MGPAEGRAGMEFSLLNDEPVTEPDADLLGAGRAARELARLLHDSRTSTPFTLAVDAGWGMGKSSLMRLVEAELRQRKDAATVWYNAWTSTGADALEGLIESTLSSAELTVLVDGLLLAALEARAADWSRTSPGPDTPHTSQCS